MHDISKITIIGTGKVAKSLTSILYKKGVLHQVYGRNIENAKRITSDYTSLLTTDSLDFSNSTSDAFLICVSDSSISSVVEQMTLPLGATLMHTSGATDIEVLSTKKNINFGVFYPLQTFTENKLETLSETPLLIEGSNEITSKKLQALASSLSQKVYITSQKDREMLHISAVFASNFMNRILHAAKEALSKTELPFEILEPLIYQSINNTISQGTQEALTGPAKRNDEKTINKHEKILEESPDLALIYKVLTNYIFDSVHKKNTTFS